MFTKEPIREMKRFSTEKAPASNLKFTKGSIIYAEFSQTGEFYMHNRRPLVVVGMPIGYYGTVICCSTTSRNVPGIAAHFYNDKGLELGGYAISTIVPYNLLPVKIEQIINSIGQLNPWIVKELDNAVAFHLGYSDIYPGYCAPGTGFYEEHLAVRYSYGRDYIDPTIPIEKEVVVPPVAPSVTPPVKIIHEEDELPFLDDGTEFTAQKEEAPIAPKVPRRKPHGRIRQGELLAVLTDEEKYGLLIGTKRGVDIAAELDIDPGTMSRLRTSVIQEATDELRVKRLQSLLRGSITNFGVLSNIDRAAITYYLPASTLELQPKDEHNLEKRILLYISQCGGKVRSDRVHPESFYAKLTSRSTT